MRLLPPWAPVLAGALAVGLFLGGGPSDARADEWSDFQAVRSYLERLELNDLAIAAVEQELASAARTDRKPALAADLANLYANILITGATDSDRYDETLAKVRTLLDRFPTAKTPRIRVILLQADYQRAESLVLAWKDAPTDRQPLEQAAMILTRVTPDLKQVADELRTTLTGLDKRTETAEGAELEELDRQRGPIASALGRAGFFAGWSCYYNWYVATQTGAAPPRGDLDTAAALFRRPLGLAEGEDYGAVEAEDLGLQVPERAQTLVGLGLTEAARGRIDETAKVFALLESPVAPSATRDDAAKWHFLALSQAGQWEAAKSFAETVVTNLPAGATQGRVNFCAILMQAGFADPAVASDPIRSRIGELGLLGLAKMRQIRVAVQLASRYAFEPGEDENRFLPLFLVAHDAVTKLPKDAPADDHARVEALLRRALAAPDAGGQPAAVAEARHGLGQTLYGQKKYADAAEQFAEAYRAWRSVDADPAVQSAWMIFTSRYRLVAGAKTPDESEVRRTLDAAETIVREFPQSRQAREVEIYIARLRSMVGAGDAAARGWEKFKPGDPQYPQAQVEIARLKYRDVLNASSPADQKASATTLVDLAKRVAGLDGLDATAKLEVVLRAVEVSQSRLDPPVWTPLMVEADRLAGSVTGNASLLADYHFRKLVQARAANDAAAVDRHVAWLIENGEGTPFEKQALVFRAQALEARRASAAEDGRAELRQVLTRVVELAGRSPDVFKADRNSLVAASRLLELLVEAGDNAAAADLGGRLLAAYPTDRKFLRLTGLAEFNTGRHASSLERWRTLLKDRSLVRGSPDAHEAKYYQIASLAPSDPAGARAVLNQYRTLYPKVEPAGLEEKFVALGQTLPK